MRKLINKLQSSFTSVGAATFTFTIVLLVLSTLIIFFAAGAGRVFQNTVANSNRNEQAFEAAEAGLEFGINYFQKNNTTIIGSPSGGYITPYSDSSTTNISLANGSKFTVVYTNPVASNYNLILVTSTGTSADGSSTRVVKQQIQFGSLLINPSTVALTSKGNVTLSGNGTVQNTTSNKTIQSASTVTLSGSSQTIISNGGGSTPGNIGGDIQQNVTSLANTSQSDYFASYFGNSSSSTVQSKVGHYYNNSSDTNYSSTLNGMEGTSVWIDQTNGSSASINGNVTIGSASNPVLLIVNGSLNLSGNINFYGFIFIIGTSGITTITGNIGIVGGIATTDNVSIGGSSELTFSSSTLTNLQNLSSLRYYAKIPGSWRDF